MHPHPDEQLQRLGRARAWADTLAAQPGQPAWVPEAVWIAELAAVALHRDTHPDVAKAAAELLAEALNGQQQRRLAGSAAAAAAAHAESLPRTPQAPAGFD